ncbi:hypothetical protein F4824DRAFT_456190 [Ustulina deusta]|nr:hypothetical protein F4824DRAFT_456190 [Ustulina deusta]
MVSANVFPPTFQSHGISFPDWISLITLALAPLIAHVVAGAPRTSYLVTTRPKWHDQLVHYNPTSILWRYSAITDRRLRATAWGREDVAAANAVFWTSHGWDGTEDMVEFSRPYCLRLPDRPHAAFLSADSVKTAILTLQGAQAAYVLVGTFFGLHEFSANLALDTTFFPFAIFGLWRLSAAMWLTDDYMFTFQHSPMKPSSNIARAESSFDSLLERSSISIDLCDRYKPTSTWPGRVCRAAYTIMLLSTWIVVILLGIPVCWAGYPCKDGFNHAASTVVQIIFFFVVVTLSLILHVYYFYNSRTTSTIIPCISARWYKIYSFLVAILAVALLALSAVETRKTPCGKYTKLPGHIGDVASCSWDQLYIPFNATGADGAAFGVAFRHSFRELSARGHTSGPQGRLWVYNFTDGACIIPGHPMVPQQPIIVEIANTTATYHTPREIS